MITNKSHRLVAKKRPEKKEIAGARCRDMKYVLPAGDADDKRDE